MKKSLQTVLKLAGIYNLLWGVLVVVFPTLFFELAELPQPLYVNIWQSVGMIVGVYGVGYYLSARDYVHHYLIVLVGLLGKLLGPIGVCYYVIAGVFPVQFLGVILFNDLIWWYPFFKMLQEAYQVHQFRK